MNASYVNAGVADPCRAFHGHRRRAAPRDRGRQLRARPCRRQIHRRLYRHFRRLGRRDHPIGPHPPQMNLLSVHLESFDRPCSGGSPNHLRRHLIQPVAGPGLSQRAGEVWADR